MKSKFAIGLAAAAVAAMATAGCATTNHDAPNPSVDIVIHWWRMETPPSVTTEFFGCLGTEELLLDQSDGNLTVTPNSSDCPKDGAPYQLVTRSGTDPAVIVGTYRLVPPDDTGKYTAVNGKA